jgi:hypothetical protein
VHFVVPADAYRVGLIECASGESHSGLRGFKDVFKVDVTRLLQDVSTFLHETEHIAVLVVWKLGTALHK